MQTGCASCIVWVSVQLWIQEPKIFVPIYKHIFVSAQTQQGFDAGEEVQHFQQQKGQHRVLHVHPGLRGGGHREVLDQPQPQPRGGAVRLQGRRWQAQAVSDRSFNPLVPGGGVQKIKICQLALTDVCSLHLWRRWYILTFTIVSFRDKWVNKVSVSSL